MDGWQQQRTAKSLVDDKARGVTIQGPRTGGNFYSHKQEQRATTPCLALIAYDSTLILPLTSSCRGIPIISPCYKGTRSIAVRRLSLSFLVTTKLVEPWNRLRA